MTLSWTSLVPPSIELALVRSQPRAASPPRRTLALPFQRIGAARRHQQLMAALVQLGAVVFEHRRDGRIGLLGFEQGRRSAPARTGRPRSSTSKRAMSARRHVSARMPASLPSASAATCPSGRPAPSADAADHFALVRQQVLGDVPALVEFADEVAPCGTRTSSKKVSQNGDLPEISRIGLVDTPGVRMSKRMKLMPMMLRRRRVGAHQAEDPVGLVGVARPDLLAVDEEMVAVVFGARRQRRQVGAGVGLRVALAPADLAARDLRQVFALLRFAAVAAAAPGRASRCRTHCSGERQPSAAHLAAQDSCFLARETAAAVFLRPVRHGPAARRHAFEPKALRRRT